MTVAGWLSPLFSAVSELRTNSWQIVAGFLEGPALLWENKALKNQMAIALAHEETHRILEQENERLRGLLGFKSQTPWQVIPAQVISRDFNGWSRSFFINKGSFHGIRAGNAVVAPTGLVGRVTEVGVRVSRMIALTDPHFRVSAILSRSRTSGLILGTAAGDCLMTYLPLETQPQAQELVTTSGGMSFCPAGIPIGRAVSIFEDASKLYRVARIVPAVNSGSLEEVLVVAWSPSDSS